MISVLSGTTPEAVRIRFIPVYCSLFNMTFVEVCFIERSNKVQMAWSLRLT